MQGCVQSARADVCVRQAGVHFRRPPRLDLVVWDVGDTCQACHRNHATLARYAGESHHAAVGSATTISDGVLSRFAGGQCWYDSGCVRA
eukprot:498885-Rhodomonas_salina.1